MSIKTNYYMQKIQYVLATAFFAFALAFIAMPTATFAGSGDYYGYDVGSVDTSDYHSTPYYNDNTSYTSDYYSTPYYNDNTSYTSDYYSTPYYNDNTSYTSDYYSTPYYNDNTSYTSDYYSTPAYSSGCSNCGGSTGYSSTPSYSYGCSNCGGSTGYSTPSYSYGCSNCGGSTGYSTGSNYGCTNCGGSHSTPTQGCTNCGGSSIPSYTTAPSTALAYSSSNPTNTSTNTNPNTNTNTNTTGPSTSNSSSTSTATGGAGGSASSSVSSTNTNLITNNPTNTNNNSASTSVNVALVNNSPSTATATNNSTTTVTVINNIVVNVPSGYAGPYVPPTTRDNDLIVTCSINPSYNVQIGQDVNFFANASGGNGNYTYSWTGSDGLNSSNQSFTGRFYNSGSKYATVTVYSNGQSRTATCSTNVGGNNNGNLSAYCTATPTVANTNQYVTWTAYPTGGNGNYSYSWTGSDGLSGNNSSLSQSYGSTGQKTATVTIYSNGQSISASCNANINAIYGYQTQASNVTLIKGTSDQIAPASGIYLGQLPATGISLSLKVVLFALGLLVWSIFAALVVSKRKNATGTVTGNAIADFKARMIAMKNR